jgi:hypothetical protein
MASRSEMNQPNPSYARSIAEIVGRATGFGRGIAVALTALPF